MINVNPCSDCPAEEQIASLRRMLLAGDLAEPYEDIIDQDDTNISFIQVCVLYVDQ